MVESLQMSKINPTAEYSDCRHSMPVVRIAYKLFHVLVFAVRRPWVLKAVLLLTVLVGALRLFPALFTEKPISFVLRSGFPVHVPASVGLPYPSILGSDVSGDISSELQQDVATRFKDHLGSKQKSPLRLLSVPQRQPSCLALVQGDQEEVNYALQYMEQNTQAKIPLSRFITAPQDCDSYVKSRGYITHSVQEERDFPIAYSIMMYRDPEQAERLLRAIYRPHNYYCIHVDAKSDKEIQDSMRGITQCLPNVFLASRQNVVDWAQFNSLEPWLYCMSDLWKYSWKYFINLTGQEFPLKTNLQIVRILKALNGANVVDTTRDPHPAWRWYETFPPPNYIRPYKGLVFMLASRGFVDYMLHNDVAHKLLRWVSYTEFPDESYFSTLNHNPHLMVPGSYKGDPETNAELKPYIARFVNWGVGWEDHEGRYPFYWPCGGKRVRRVCVFGVRDLPLLTDRKELFANKFIFDFQHWALDCLEEWHFNMTLVEYAGKLTIDTSWYSDLDIVRNQVL